jgi:hypothetical protein
VESQEVSGSKSISTLGSDDYLSNYLKGKFRRENDDLELSNFSFEEEMNDDSTEIVKNNVKDDDMFQSYFSDNFNENESDIELSKFSFENLPDDNAMNLVSNGDLSFKSHLSSPGLIELNPSNPSTPLPRNQLLNIDNLISDEFEDKSSCFVEKKELDLSEDLYGKKQFALLNIEKNIFLNELNKLEMGFFYNREIVDKELYLNGDFVYSKVDLLAGHLITLWGIFVKRSKFLTKIIKVTESYGLLKTDVTNCLGLKIPIFCTGDVKLQLFTNNESYKLCYVVQKKIPAGKLITAGGSFLNTGFQRIELCINPHENCKIVIQPQIQEALRLFTEKMYFVEYKKNIDEKSMEEFFNFKLDSIGVWCLFENLLSERNKSQMLVYLVCHLILSKNHSMVYKLKHKTKKGNIVNCRTVKEKLLKYSNDSRKGKKEKKMFQISRIVSSYHMVLLYLF